MRPFVSPPEGSGFGVVANRLNVVPVRTNDESCIVGRVVLQTQARRTIVLTACRQSRAMESLNLLLILGPECQMKIGRLFLNLKQALGRHAICAKLDTQGPLLDNGYTERFKRLEKERFAGGIVAHSDDNVVKHGSS